MILFFSILSLIDRNFRSRSLQTGEVNMEEEEEGEEEEEEV